MLKLADVYEWMQRKQVLLLLLIIIIIGILLRFYDIGAESIWLDEAASIDLSSQSISSIIGESPDHNHPPLYFIILHFWMNLFGDSEVATRSLSALFGIASIILIYYVGSILFNRRVGLIAAFLSAISHYHIYYSQEVRTYSLLLLCSLLSYLFFVKILKEGKKWHYPCYFLSNLLLGYTHMFGLLIITSQLLYFLIFWNRYRYQRVGFSITTVGTIIALIPLVLIIYGRVETLTEHGFWISVPGLNTVYSTFIEFSGTGSGQGFLLLVFCLLIVFGFFSVKKIKGKWSWRRPVDSTNDLQWYIKLESIREECLLIVWLSVSIIIPFIESKLMTPLYITRYLVGASAAFYLLVAKGMAGLNRKHFVYIILTFVVLLSALGLRNYYKNDVKTQWREAVDFIEVNSRVDSDVALFYPSFSLSPFNYYYTGELPGLGINVEMSDAEAVADFMDNALFGKDRIWLILSLGEQAGAIPITSYLADTYGSSSIILEKGFLGVSVLLFDLSQP